MTAYQPDIYSGTFIEDTQREDRIRNLSSRASSGGLSLQDQIQLHNDIQTRLIKRTQRQQEAQREIAEKEARMRLLELNASLEDFPKMRQATVQSQQADIASRMFNPATYADTLRRQQEMERQKMAMENSAMMLRRKQMQEMGSRFGLGTNPEFLRGLGVSPTQSLQPSWSSNYRVPVFPA